MPKRYWFYILPLLVLFLAAGGILILDAAAVEKVGDSLAQVSAEGILIPEAAALEEDGDSLAQLSAGGVLIPEAAAIGEDDGSQAQVSAGGILIPEAAALEEDDVFPPQVSAAVSLTAVGDVMLGRNVGKAIEKQGYNYPFSALDGYMAKADITFGNLESPLSTGGKKLYGKSVVLRGDPKMAPVLAEQGFDVLSLANNHMMDYNSEALLDTIVALRDSGIEPIGAGADLAEATQAVIMNSNGLRIGFLAYTDKYKTEYFTKKSFAATGDSCGVAPLDRKGILEDVKALADEVDVIVVSLHWGKEYKSKPATADVKLAHEIIDAGAALVIGHHPHRLQGVERYGKGLIAYSLGNFIFDQKTALYMRQSMILDVELAPGKVVEATLTPVLITNSQPAILTGSKASSLLKKIAGYCKKLNTSTIIENDKLIINID